jgi:S1-C subfamily serine protease
MSKATLYSRSGHARRAPGASAAARPPQSDESVATPAAVATSAFAAKPSRLRASWQRLRARHDRALLLFAAVAIALVLILAHAALTRPPRAITQHDIDAAVQHTLETVPMPSRAAKASEAIRKSVVRVRGLGHEKEKDGHVLHGVGSGVVIVDTGIILTNLHVVAGAERVLVEFDDGLEAEATVIGARPEHDLAVLQAKTLPDDLPAATLRSTADLAPGDEVIAVGFPFAIGPSVSAGVISGLRREYRSPQGQRVLTNLIQFDAAVNPGNSGGPLVTMDGEVVGIVTAILNPTEQSVFIGIGFAVPIENAAAAIGVSPF